VWLSRTLLYLIMSELADASGKSAWHGMATAVQLSKLHRCSLVNTPLVALGPQHWASVWERLQLSPGRLLSSGREGVGGRVPPPLVFDYSKDALAVPVACDPRPITN